MVRALSAECDDAPLVRPYHPDDYEAVIRMFVEAARGDKDIRSVRLVGCPAWVAVADGVVAGFIDIGDEGHLNVLIVQSSHRRAGFASSLLRTAEADARRRGAHPDPGPRRKRCAAVFHAKRFHPNPVLFGVQLCTPNNTATPTLEQFLAGLRTAWETGDARPTSRPKPILKRERGRPDPFVAVTEKLQSWFEEAQQQTARELLSRLQDDHPGVYPDDLLRSLQRRVKVWRHEAASQLVVGFIPDPAEAVLVPMQACR